ncbi:hypothetical protein [Nitrosomonas aestuarii]|uniref:hypothetical protein n=1 Tax=Nitrosomonas aestuarii TaxID=52441 RepID=UPI000D2F8F0C|nr:hypothetical protein [Nitrosomonas aestuarii]PTN12142.1 hypothetical protein C8R11_105104 [Nitrosomonas aestuarii]
MVFEYELRINATNCRRPDKNNVLIAVEDWSCDSRIMRKLLINMQELPGKDQYQQKSIKYNSLVIFPDSFWILIGGKF